MQLPAIVIDTRLHEDILIYICMRQEVRYINMFRHFVSHFQGNVKGYEAVY